MSDQFRTQFLNRVAQQDLPLQDAAVDRLLAYHGLLVKWNKAFNLTSVRDAGEMIDRHLIDSLSILPFIGEGELLDVGTGPGLPGMIIALTRPEQSVWLLDSNGKKTRFLNQVKMTLDVKNVTVIHERLETWSPKGNFPLITSRAFATLSDMVRFSRHLLSSDGRFLAMKGVYPEQEIAQLPADIEVFSVKPLNVPGTDGQRHLVELGFKAQ